MGDAARRKALGLPPRGIKPEPVNLAGLQRHVLALQDRRMEPDEAGAIVFSDHSAKPGRYASADLRTLYQWDGVCLRRLDRQTLTPHNGSHS